MDLIKLSSALKRKQKVQQCIMQIREKLSEIPDLHTFKNSDELFEIICCVVENLLSKKAKKYKIAKKGVVFSVYNELFPSNPLTPEEKEMLSKRIEYLHEKGLIHGVNFLKWAGKGLLNWLLRKLL